MAQTDNDAAAGGPTPQRAAPLTSGPPPERSPVSAMLRRLAIPIACLIAAAIFVTLATLRWDAWVGNAVTQTTNDAYVRAQTTQLSSRVAGEVIKVAASDYQRVKAGDLLVEIDARTVRRHSCAKGGDPGQKPPPALPPRLQQRLRCNRPDFSGADQPRRAASERNSQRPGQSLSARPPMECRPFARFQEEPSPAATREYGRRACARNIPRPR